MRGSILSRPLRAASRINEESIDSEYEKEVLRLEARKQKLSATEEAMRKLRLSEKRDAETKMKLFEENREAFVTHMKHVQEHEILERQSEERNRAELHEIEQQQVDQFLSEKHRKQEEARQIMEDNRRLAEDRLQRLKEEKLRDQSIDRQNLRVLEESYSQRRLR